MVCATVLSYLTHNQQVIAEAPSLMAIALGLLQPIK